MSDRKVIIDFNTLRELSRLIKYGVLHDKVELENLLCHEGNQKIPSTTAIFNMGSAKDCPSKRLGLCRAFDSEGKHICYAKKAECIYPYALPYRCRQKDFWLRISPEEFVFQFLIVNGTKRIPFNALRFNESGDFWGQDCIDKAEKIARLLKPYGIVCYCYTSRSDLDFSRVRKLRVSGSGFQKDGVTNEFKIIEKKEDRPKGYGICPMDCSICNRCMKTGMKTAVVIH